MTDNIERDAGPTSAGADWLCGALVFMPLLQALPIDFDRAGVLILLAPALWAGRKELALGVADLLGSRWLSVALAIGAVFTAIATGTADQPAAALVTTAKWILLAAIAILAGRWVRTDPRAGRRILQGLAIGAALGTATTWTWWVLDGRRNMPLYAHHRHLGLHAVGAAVASTALLWRSSGRRAEKAVWACVGITCWAGLFWSGGRGPVIALAAALAGWWWVARSERSRLIQVCVLQAVGGLVLSAVFWTSRPELGWWHAFERTAGATEAHDIAALTSDRNEVWRDTLHRVLQRPWLGHGPDAYRFLTPQLDGEQPHNLVLQLWLDLGLIGGTVLAVLAIGGAVLGWRRARQAGGANDAVWAALFTALLLEGMLDGVFYHLLAFLPTMIAAGVVLAPSERRRARPPWWTAAAVPVTSMAAAVLLVHSVVFYELAIATPPADAQAPAARLVRAFPSTTYGLWRWLDVWEKTAPATALDWTTWAAAHASNAPLFHVRAAILLARHGERQAALEQLRLAEAKAHWHVRPDITKMRVDLENAPH